jgi:hypothetical protein
LFLSIDKPMVAFNNTKVIKGIASAAFVGFMWFCGVNIPIYNQLVGYTIMPQNMVDYQSNVSQLTQLVDNNTLWSFPALMVLDNYILPTSPQTNGALSIQDQLRYIDMLGNELPYPGAIFKQIIIHKVVGDNVGSLYYANLLAHAYPYFKDKFAAQLQNTPAFADDVAAIQGFHYQDKSIFNRWFPKGDR